MKNIGSITAIYYALASDIVSISDPDENDAVLITMASGKSLSPFSFTLETASFTEEFQENNAGPIIEMNLQFRCPKINTVQHAVIRSLADQELILVITDGNGTTTVMGSLEAPARLSSKIIRPASSSGYNGYEVSVKALGTEPAWFLDESFVLS